MSEGSKWEDQRGLRVDTIGSTQTNREASTSSFGFDTTPPQSPSSSGPTLVGITVPDKEDWSEEFDLSKPLLFRSNNENIQATSRSQSARVSSGDVSGIGLLSPKSGIMEDGDLDWTSIDINGSDQVYSRYLRRGSVHFDTDDQKWQAFKANRQEETIKEIVRTYSKNNQTEREDTSVQIENESTRTDEQNNNGSRIRETSGTTAQKPVSSATEGLRLNLVSVEAQHRTLNDSEVKIAADGAEDCTGIDSDSDSSFEDWDQEFENEYASSEAGESATTPLGMSTPVTQQQKAFRAQLEGLRNVVLQDEHSSNGNAIHHKSSGASLLPSFHQLSHVLKRRRPNPTILRYPRSSELYTLRTVQGQRSLSENQHDKFLVSLGATTLTCAASSSDANIVIKYTKRTVSKNPVGSSLWCSAHLEAARVCLFVNRDYGACMQQVLRFFNSLHQFVRDLEKGRNKKKSTQATIPDFHENANDKATVLISIESGPRNSDENVEYPRWAYTLDTASKLLRLYIEAFSSVVLNDTPPQSESSSERRSWIPSNKSTGTSNTIGMKPSLAKFISTLQRFVALLPNSTMLQLDPTQKHKESNGKVDKLHSVNPAKGVTSATAAMLRCQEAECVLHMLTELPTSKHVPHESHASHRSSKSTFSTSNDLTALKVNLVRESRYFQPLRSIATPFLSQEAVLLEGTLGQLCTAYGIAEHMLKQKEEQLYGLWVDASHPQSVCVEVLCDIQLVLFGICPITMMDCVRLHETLEELRCGAEEALESHRGMERGSDGNFEQTDESFNFDVDSILGIGFILPMETSQSSLLVTPPSPTSTASTVPESVGDNGPLPTNQTTGYRPSSPSHRSTATSTSSIGEPVACHTLDAEITPALFKKLCSLDPSFRMGKLLELYSSLRGDSTLKAKAAYTLAQYFLRVHGNVEVAEQLLFEAVFVLHSVGSGNYQPLVRQFGVKLLREYGEILVESKKYKFAISSLESSAELHRTVHRVEDSKLIRKLCGICVDNLDWDRALRYHYQVLGSCAVAGNINEFVYVSERIAGILADNKADFSRAVSVLEQAIHFLRTKAISSSGAGSPGHSNLSMQHQDVGGSVRRESNTISNRLHRSSTAAATVGSTDQTTPLLQQRKSTSRANVRRWTSNAVRSSSTSPRRVRGRKEPVQRGFEVAASESPGRAISTGTHPGPALDQLDTPRGRPSSAIEGRRRDTLTSHELLLYVKLELKLVHVLLSAYRIPDAMIHIARILDESTGLIPQKLTSNVFLLLAKVALKAGWLIDCRDALVNAGSLWDSEWQCPDHNIDVDGVILRTLLSESTEVHPHHSLNIVIRNHLVNVPSESIVSYTTLWSRYLSKNRVPGHALLWINALLQIAHIDPDSGSSITPERDSLDVYPPQPSVVLTIGQIGRLFFYKGKILQQLLEGTTESATTTSEGSHVSEWCNTMLRYCVKFYWNANQYFGVVNDTIWQAKTLARVAQVELHVMLQQETWTGSRDSSVTEDPVPAGFQAEDFRRVLLPQQQGEPVPVSAWWLRDRSTADNDVAVRVQRCEQPCLLSVDLCADAGYPPLMIRCLLNMLELLMLEDDLDRAREYWAEASILVCSYYLCSGSVQLFSSNGGSTMETHGKFEVSELWIPAANLSPGIIRRLKQYLARLLRSAAICPVLVHSTTMHRRLVATFNWLIEKYHEQEYFARNGLRALSWSNIQDVTEAMYVPCYPEVKSAAVAISQGDLNAMVHVSQLHGVAALGTEHHAPSEVARPPGNSNTRHSVSLPVVRIYNRKSRSGELGEPGTPSLVEVHEGRVQSFRRRSTLNNSTETPSSDTVSLFASENIDSDATFIPIQSTKVWSLYHRVLRLTFWDMGSSLRVQEVREQNQTLLRKVHQTSSSIGVPQALSPKAALCHSPSNAAALLGATRGSPVGSDQVKVAAATPSLSPLAAGSEGKTTEESGGRVQKGHVSTGTRRTVSKGPWHQSGASMLFCFDHWIGSLGYSTKQSAPWATRLCVSNQTSITLEEIDWVVGRRTEGVEGSPNSLDSTRCPEEWIALVVRSIGLRNTLDLISCLLAEAPVVVVSVFPDVCEHVVRSLVDILQPFDWQNCCIPFVPAPLVKSVCRSLIAEPGRSFVIGVHPNHIEYIKEQFGSHIITLVDIDRGTISFGTEFMLPQVNERSSSLGSESFDSAQQQHSVNSHVSHENNHQKPTRYKAVCGFPKPLVSLIEQESLRFAPNDYNSLGALVQQSMLGIHATVLRGLPLFVNKNGTFSDTIGSNIAQCNLPDTQSFANWFCALPIFKRFISQVTMLLQGKDCGEHVKNMWSRLNSHIELMSVQVERVQSQPKSGWLSIVVNDVGDDKTSRMKGFSWTKTKPKKKWCELDMVAKTFTYYYGKSKVKAKGSLKLGSNTVVHSPTCYPFGNVFDSTMCINGPNSAGQTFGNEDSVTIDRVVAPNVAMEDWFIFSDGSKRITVQSCSSEDPSTDTEPWFSLIVLMSLGMDQLLAKVGSNPM